MQKRRGQSERSADEWAAVGHGLGTVPKPLAFISADRWHYTPWNHLGKLV